MRVFTWQHLENQPKKSKLEDPFLFGEKETTTYDDKVAPETQTRSGFDTDSEHLRGNERFQDFRLKIQPLQKKPLRFFVVSSIAFVKPKGSSEINIKCLEDCAGFQGFFKSDESMEDPTIEHFAKFHSETNWDGHCSKCKKYVEKGNDLTIKDELQHVKNYH